MIVPVEKYKLLSDAELLNLYRTNDDKIFLTELFLRYVNLLNGICLKYLKNTELSKDAISSIYEDLITNAKKYQIISFKSWIYAVTKNYCITYLKKNKIHITEIHDDITAPFNDYAKLDYFLEKEKQFMNLEKCLETLSKDQYLTIKLFYLENKCYNEISEKTGKEWNKIRSLIQNGKRNLKNCMEAS